MILYNKSMKLTNKILILTFACGIPAFLLGRVIWPDPVGAVPPTTGELPFFVLLSVIEAVVFGLGVSLVVFGRSLLENVPERYRTRAVLSFISVAWLLISWWPHDNMHRANGENLQGLLLIEYQFHVTLIAASLIIAYCLITLLREAANSRQS